MFAMLLALAAASETPPPDSANVALGADRHARMTVPVRIAGSEAFPFVIDTGAERTVISRQLADRLGLAQGPVRNLVTVTGAGKVNTVLVPSLELSGSKVKEIEAPALDQAHIGASGMLGIDSLQTRRVLLDFKKNEMKVVPSRYAGDTDPDTIVVTARSKYGQLILVDSRFLGEKVQVIIDTGAQTSIGNLALLKRITQRKKAPVTRTVTVTSVTGQTLEAQFAQIERIQIGGVDMNNIPVAFTDAEPFKRFGLANKPALLLGMDALRLFERVSVDFANKQVRFIMPDGASLTGRTLMAAR
ncbi:retroviral-like aspartic protease family protein [Sphingomonas tabacisoli]|uniref:Retroviral-like aspartic protease family protein n=1 Tax=Sphingomonas tabacisoli TaxID=2249466 RepID=A0ABW4HYF1_9SPHN